MIINWSNDGRKYDRKEILRLGFEINEAKDVNKVSLYDKATGEPLDEYAYVYDFVGFLVNENNDILTIFPKHFNVDDLKNDSSMIFELISKHMQKRPDMYMGEQYGKKFETNYPFAAFFGIYDYYQKYGLYVENREYIKPNIGGKINWKETNRKAGFYLIDSEITLFPYYYNKKYYFSNFITECMIFVIDYTIQKFDAFISLTPTYERFPEYNFIEECEAVVNTLYCIRQQVFRDNVLEMIDNLINFFTNINEGGAYYLKHYAFSSIWEDIVMTYLSMNFKEVKGNSLIFDEKSAKHLDFKKVSFHPNAKNKRHYISPDYYCFDGSTQFIFDAKYKNSINGIDYKQVSYFMFLKELRDSKTLHRKFTDTYSALLLPSEKHYSEVHFEMDTLFSMVNSDIKIIEQYLDIKEVIMYYLEH